MRRACLGLADGFCHAGAQAIKTTDIGARVGLVVDAVDVDKERWQLALRAIHLVKDIAIIIICISGFAAFSSLFKQAVGQAIFGRKLGRVKTGAHFLQRRTLGFMRAHFAGGGKITPTAIIAVLDTAIGFAERRKRQLLRIIFFKECLDGGVLIDLGDGSGCGIGRLRKRRGAQLHQSDGKSRNRGFVYTHSKLS